MKTVTWSRKISSPLSLDVWTYAPKRVCQIKPAPKCRLQHNDREFFWFQSKRHWNLETFSARSYKIGSKVFPSSQVFPTFTLFCSNVLFTTAFPEKSLPLIVKPKQVWLYWTGGLLNGGRWLHIKVLWQNPMYKKLVGQGKTYQLMRLGLKKRCSTDVKLKNQ